MDYAQEKLEQARDALDSGTLPQSLVSAGEIIARVERTDFPAELRLQLAQIYEAITAAGSIEHSVQRMTPERSAEIAQAIRDLGTEVDRRCGD